MSALGFIVISPAGPRRAYTTPALAIAAARAGAAGVLDLEFVKDSSELRKALQQLAQQALGGRIGIRCRSGNLFASEAFDAIFSVPSNSENNFGEKHLSVQSRLQPVMVLTAGISEFELKVLQSDIETAKSQGFHVFVETVSIEEALLAESAGADAIIAKGHEAAGRVGDTTTFVLVQQCSRSLKIPVWALGGIGLHSSAAVAAAGAAGVVLDSQVFLCRDSAIPADVQLRFERLDGSETTLIRDREGRGIRVMATNGSARLQELEHLYTDGRIADAQAILESNIDSNEDELFVVGQDSCFSKTLALAGGTVSGCIDLISRNVAEHIEIASRSNVLAEGSELARSHCTQYPVVQGAMTRVSDTSEFALKVAEAGALPFLALSLMRGPEIEKLLDDTRAKLGKLPWGVGILGFVPQQLRQEQMEVVNRHKPPFALIAGGRPDQARALDDAGTKTYLHVPSPLLLKSFIEMGSTRFIFEGKECGGHVGPRSSFVLWESMIEVLLETFARLGPKNNPSNIHVLFAGGIHDDLSAAMVATMAAPLTARGIKVGVLVGTAYLFTEEAVSAGAIVPVFQEAAIKCDRTVLLETGPGHSIRCIESPYKEAFDRCRTDLQKQNKNRDEIREELELMNLGRLRIASKGIVRGAGAELENIPVESQWRDGMYMIGQVAALRDKVVTMSDLHRNICSDGQRRLGELKLQFAEPVSRERQSEGIAIVGMSCMFPQGNDVETYWQNILNKVDAITEIPETHFKWQNYYDENPLARDRIVSKWGGFLTDVVFDPTPYGIPPSSLDSIDPIQVLVLEAARSALYDAGYNERKFPRENTSVILANAGHGPITALYSLRSMLGWKLDELDDSAQEKIKSRLPEWTEDSFAGYLGNVTAGRIANRLDLKGLNFSIDAACASSLAALYVAIADLRAGTSDVVLLGATDTHNQPGDYLSFSKTHALSPKGKCQTFDENADGIAISEGLAMLVLKRVTDAQRDGDRIYAVIKGIGGSSDGRDLSLTAPRPAGQMLALERAYVDAGISPATVGLVEAHGTGTVAGDRAEVEALTKVFQAAGAAPESCAIGSVKTNIGHSKAAAGLASIVKIAKALHHKVLPPSINVKKPNPACKFGEGPFYLNTECRPWIHNDTSTPRRAGVSAFGFGGTNFHTILEEYVAPCVTEEGPTVQAWPAELFVWKAASQEDLLKGLKQTEAAVEKLLTIETAETTATSMESRRLFDLASKLQLKLNDVPTVKHALSIVASSLADLKNKIATAKEKCGSASFSLPNGIHYSTGTTVVPKLAFLFPGQGSQRVEMLKGLSLYFPEIRKTIEESDEILRDKIGSSLSNYIYPAPVFSETQQSELHERLTKTEIAQPALGVCDLAMYRLLKSFGLKPDMVAGHSYGEYVALHAAGVFSVEQLLNLSADRGRILAECAVDNPGAMAAVSSDPDTVGAIAKELPGVYIANINTPTQVIISGAVDAIESALKEFKKRDIACKRISVSAAFHSPLLSASKQPLIEALSKYEYAAPNIAVYSNTTAAPYGNETKDVVLQLGEHALKPVLFAQQLQAMYDAGARVFVEVGPGSVLTGLTENTLGGKDAVAISTERQKNPLEHFLSVIGLLTVNGVIKEIGKLYWNRMPGVHGNSYELMVAKNRSPLLYRVNSVKIERVDGVGIKKVMGRNTGNQMAQNFRNGDDIAKNEVVKDKLVRDERALQAPSSNGANGNQSAPSGNGRVNVPQSHDNGNNNGNVGNGASNNFGKSNTQTPATYGAPTAQQGGMNRTMPGAQHQSNSNVQHQSNLSRPDYDPRSNGVERVMLDFQQSMMDMTNRFLETQERVMLAYLQSGGARSGPQQGIPQGGAAQGGYAPNASEHAGYQQTGYPQNGFVQGYSQGGNSQGGYSQSGNSQGDNSQGGFPPQAYDVSNQFGNNGNNGFVGTESASHVGRAHGGNEIRNEYQMQAPALQTIDNASFDSQGRQLHEQLGQHVQAEAVQVGTESASGLNTEALIDSLYEIVSERTGYPRTMLDPTLDLEADLGIDSIKRVEILNNFRKLLPEFSQEKLESGIEKLAGTKTLEGIIEWIRSLDDVGETNSTEVVEVGNADNVGRGLVKVKQLDAPGVCADKLAPTTLIVSNRNDYASSVEKLLVDRGQTTVVLQPSDLRAKEIGYVIDGIRKEHGSIGSLFYVNGPSIEAPSKDAQFQLVTDFFQLVKEVEPDLKEHALDGYRSAVVCATFLGGAFNSLGAIAEIELESLVQQAGLVGLSKTVAKEFAGVHVKAVDFESSVAPEVLADTVVSELLANDDIVEVGLQAGRRVGLEVVQSPYAAATNSNPPLSSSSMVLVTGGARGITAEITLDLARRYKPGFIIVGRLPRPTETESPVTAGLESPKDIKAAIIGDMQANGKIINVRDVERSYQQLLREREVRTTLSKLQAAGSTVRYYSVDVTDEQAFGKLIDSIYETSTIDGVIHGAGIIEDALIKDKSLESFERVYGTKVKSALTLARKVRFDSLRFMYFFSSVVGRTGNSGQSDYVSANESLSKLAVHISKNSPARIASLMWGPWQAGMAPPELEEVFASHGWSMIQPADGRVCFYEELNHNGVDEVEVLLVGKLKSAKNPEPHSREVNSDGSKEKAVMRQLEQASASSQLDQKLDSRQGKPAVASKLPSEVKPSGAVLHSARLQSMEPPSFAFSINTNDHRYLHDHKFDGIPVMPMAVALEMMLEAARSLYPDRHLVSVSNLDIPAGIVFHTEQKDFLVEAKPERGQDGEVALQLLSVGSINKAHFRCKAKLSPAPNSVPEHWLTQASTDIPRLIGACSTLPCETAVPQPQNVYGKWLFHGTIFQGIKEVLFLAEDGIAGNIAGAVPTDCITSADSSRWNVDPVLLDSAMQLAGIWARHYRDVTVLPTGFKTMYFFGPMPARATAQVFLNPAMTTELLCDLAIYDESGKLALVVEGLGGIASKAFNRFSSQEPVKQLVP